MRRPTTFPFWSAGYPPGFTGNEAWYDASDVNSMRNNAGAVPSNGEGIKLISDKSGNSSVNVLCLPGTASNYASFSALTAFGTADFTVSSRVYLSTLSALSAVFGGATNSFTLRINATTGTVFSGKINVGDNTASTGAVGSLQYVDIAYVRSGTTGTYYINGAAAGTTTDNRDYTVGCTLLGYRVLGGTDYFNGNISFARVYSVALTAPQVAADAAGTVQSNCTFNANFATAAKLAPSFTESSSNAATVTINTSGATGARISGARDLYQGTAANQPILTIAAGGNYLTFDGSNDYLKAAAFALAQPTSIYLVGSQISWTSTDILFDGNVASTYLEQRNSTPNVRLRGNVSALGDITTWALNTAAVITGIANGASSSERINRSAATTGTVDTTAMNGFTLGASQSGGANANITASEVLVYSTAQNTAQQDAVILYEGRKWGLSV